MALAWRHKSFPLNILRKKWWISMKFDVWIHINKIELGTVTWKFMSIFNRVMALAWRHKSFPLNILRKKWWISIKFDVWIHIDKIELGTVTRKFVSIFNRVMALAWCPKIISVQYLKKEKMDFDRIQHMNLSRDCCMAFRVNFQQSYGPRLTSKNPFRSISWERNYEFQPNLAYELI